MNVRAKRSISRLDRSPTAPTRSKTQTKGAQGRTTMRSVALDLGNRITFCEVSEGRVVRRLTVNRFSDLLSVLGPKTEPATVAFEASREGWFVHDQLAAWGHKPVMVDTTRVRQLGIGQHGRKTDRIDAEILARAIESGSVPLAHVLSPHRRSLRTQLMVRKGLVETRTQLVVTIRGLLRSTYGLRLRGCEAERFHELVHETQLSDEQRSLVKPLVELLEQLAPRIEQVEQRLEELSDQEPIIRNLKTVPGVASIVSAAFVSVVDEANRFKTAHQLESYVGLVPLEKTSGKRKLGAITKQGNPYLRSLLIQAAWVILRRNDPNDPLNLWAQAVAEKRGKRIAVVALARRLIGVLWALWRDGTVYDPGHLSRQSAKGIEKAAQSQTMKAAALRRAALKTLRVKAKPLSREVRIG
jgi:transposase